MEGFVAVLGLVCVMEEQKAGGSCGTGGAGSGTWLKVLLLLAPVEVEGLAVEGLLLWFFAGLHAVGGFGAGGLLSDISIYTDLI